MNQRLREYPMPLGKFEGVPVGELPLDYLTWLSGLPNLREPLRTAVRQELALGSGGCGESVAETVDRWYRALAELCRWFERRTRTREVSNAR